MCCVCLVGLVVCLVIGVFGLVGKPYQHLLFTSYKSYEAQIVKDCQYPRDLLQPVRKKIGWPFSDASLVLHSLSNLHTLFFTTPTHSMHLANEFDARLSHPFHLPVSPFGIFCCREFVA